MKKYILVFIISLLWACNGQLFSQVSTEGTDFWISYGKNFGADWYGGITSSFSTLQIRIVASQYTEGTITFTAGTSGSNSETFSIPAGSVYTRDLSPAERLLVYSDVTGTSSKSVHVQTNAPVSVYALNQSRANADATNILPTDRLGANYYQVSYASNVEGSACYDGYTIVATEDNTLIYENGGSSKATLQKGQVYSYYATSITTDLSGRNITASKPIALFVTNTGLYLPKGYQAADNLYQQMMPVDMWGSTFMVPVSLRRIERVKIMASQANTIITQVGGTLKTDNGGSSSYTIGKGQFVELDVTSSQNGCYITSTKPVAVCSFMVGSTYAQNVGGYPSKAGDPAETWIPPIEQAVKRTTIAPFVPSGQTQLDQHHVLIVTATATKAETTMALGTGNSAALSGGTWTDNTYSDYSYYSLLLTAEGSTSYTFENPNGIIVLGYGLGSDESYYYLAGSATRILTPSFYVNNIHYEDLNGQTICDAPYNVQGIVNENEMSTAAGHLIWTLDGVEQPFARDQLIWSIPTLTNGTHTITMSVLKTSGATQTISSTFDVECIIPIDAVDDYAQALSGINKGYPVEINVLANDDLGACDVSDISLLLVSTAPPQHGMVSVDENKNIIYTPFAGYEGADSFQYKIDCSGTADVATVYINVVKMADNITPVEQEVCVDEDAVMVCNLELTGGTNYYQWQYSVDNSTWIDIVGATQRVYIVSGRKRGITYYRTVVKDGINIVNTESTFIRVKSCKLPVNHNISVFGN